MSRSRGLIAILTLLTTLAAACQKEDPKVAELQKQLAEVQKQLAANNQSANAATPAPAEAPAAAPAPAPQAAAPATPAPGRTSAKDDAKAAQQTADTAVAATERNAKAIDANKQAIGENKKGIEENKAGVAENKAAIGKQAEAHAALKSDVEAMKSREYTIPHGTPIAVRTTAELSTKDVKDGSIFEGLLERDLVVDGATLAKAGSHVTCIVVNSDEGGRVKGVASLSVAARSIAGVRGNTINLKTSSYTVDANTTKGRDVGRTGIATGAGAAVGAIAGGGKGAAIGAVVGGAGGAILAQDRDQYLDLPPGTQVTIVVVAPRYRTP